MDDYIRAIFAAWERVKEGLAGNPAELLRRLQRRRRAVLERPPRAWCLAVRAGDRRINPWNAAVVPEWAWPRVDDEGRKVTEPAEHEVVLDSRLLRMVCRPVEMDRFGMMVPDVAKGLGCPADVLRKARKNGAVKERWVDGPGGKKRAIICNLDGLDPGSSSAWRMADPVWGTSWRFLADHVPEGIEQVVVRRPDFAYRAGREGFWGWKWACPGCRKSCKTLFYPLPPLLRPELSFKGLELPGGWEMEGPARAGCFACVRCHRLRYFTRVERNAWNDVVTNLSGGLLYGSEVPRPGWFKAGAVRRKRQVPHLGRKPSERREQVRRLLLGTEMTLREIAGELGVGRATVKSHVEVIYTSAGVRSRGELRGKEEPERSVVSG